MNNYECECLCNNEIRVLTVQSYSKRQAQTIIRTLMRQSGYMVRLKDIHVMYIDNAREPMNRG